MFWLERGNPDNLEGKVLIYSRFIGDIEELESLVSHESPSLAKSIAICALNSKLDDPILAVEACHHSDVGCIFEYERGKIIKPVKSIMAKIINTSINSQDEIEEYPGDVIFTGEYFKVGPGIKSLELGVMAYFNCYCDNLYEGDDKNLIRENTPFVKNDITYENIPSRNLYDYVLKKFTLPLLEAKKSGRKEAFDRISKELIYFTRNRSTSYAASALVNVLSNDKYSGKHMKIAELITKQIGAIAEDNYEQAHIIKTQIDAINGRASV